MNTKINNMSINDFANDNFNSCSKWKMICIILLEICVKKQKNCLNSDIYNCVKMY
jgi:hypothetical protein